MSDNQVTNNYGNPNEDQGSFGWAVLGFFFPLIGLILFLCWMNTKKKSAKQAGIGALVGFCSKIILSVVVTILSIFFAFSSISTSVFDSECEDRYGVGFEKLYENGTYYCYNEETEEKHLFRSLFYDGEEDEEDENYKMFKKLDYSNKTSMIIDDERRIYIDGDNIKYVDPNVNDGAVQVIEEPNVISVGMDCDCGACTNIYYLTKNKELYEYELDHGYIVKDENGNIDEKYHKLIASNVTGMTMFDVKNLNNEEETCGGYYVVYKLQSGKVLFK